MEYKTDDNSNIEIKGLIRKYRLFSKIKFLDDKILRDYDSRIAKKVMKECGYGRMSDEKRKFFWNKNYMKVKTELYSHRSTVTCLIKRTWMTRK